MSSSDASKIIISSNKKDKTLTISDNGVGLNEEEMIEDPEHFQHFYYTTLLLKS